MSSVCNPPGSALQLDARRLRVLDDAVATLLPLLETKSTLSFLTGFFVPKYADWAYLTTRDSAGAERLAAARHPDPEADAALTSCIGTDVSSVPCSDMLQHVGSHTVVKLPLAAGGDDLGTLHLCLSAVTRTFEAADRPLFEKIVQRAAQALFNGRRFERERNVALTFQNAALAAELPAIDGYRFDAIYEAGRAEALVGGDWYDAFRLIDGRIVVSVGDVVGSGLDAAVAMVNVRQTIRGVAQVHPDPALMLEAADRTLRSQHPDRYVTTFVGVFDPVTQHCAFANAGHPQPFVRFADGTMAQTRGRGIPLGLDFEQHVEVHQVVIPSGALLVLYTDGLIEAQKDVLDGERRLRSVLQSADLLDHHNIAQRIHDAVLEGHSRDDVAILAVLFECVPPVRRWRFDPMWSDVAARVRSELCDELVRSGMTSVQLFDLELVLAELLGNLIRYAPGTVELILEAGEGKHVLHVLDKGPGFQFAPKLPADLYSEYGRGLFLIAQSSAEFSVERRPGGGSHARIVFQKGTGTQIS